MLLLVSLGEPPPALGRVGLTSLGKLNRWDTATYGAAAVLSETSGKKPRTDIRDYRLFAGWKFGNNVTARDSACVA